MGRREIVFKTPWFEIESEEFDDIPELGGKPMYRMNVPPSVMALAFTKEGRLILIRQFRPATRCHTLELPTGYVDEGETLEEAARRELVEETGYRSPEWHFVGQNPVAADRINGHFSIFFCRNAEMDPDVKKEDGIEVLAVSTEEVKNLALKGELGSVWVLGALVLAKWKLSPRELEKF